MNKGKELLTKLRDGLMTLKPEEFDYERLVSKFDRKNNCGTVCCALGWAPRFIPEADFYWVFGGYGGRLRHEEYFFAENAATIKFGLSKYKVMFMFYGLDDFSLTGIKPDVKKFGLGHYATLQQVINRITYVIENCY